jgi:hypothetical protein
MMFYCHFCQKKNEVDYHTSTESYTIYMCSACGTQIPVPLPVEKLIDVPFDSALSLKFQRGRVEHGPVFLRNPVQEIDEELIDAMNYADEAIRQGFDIDIMNVIKLRLREVDELVRMVYYNPEMGPRDQDDAASLPERKPRKRSSASSL